MSDIWHITNQDENTTDIPEKENFVVLIGHWTSCLWYGGEEPEPIFWENVKKWCYFDDLLDLETELDRTRKALDVAVDALDAGKTLADIAGFKMLVAGLEEALAKIKTALEQKDK